MISMILHESEEKFEAKLRISVNNNDIIQMHLEYIYLAYHPKDSTNESMLPL